MKTVAFPTPLFLEIAGGNKAESLLQGDSEHIIVRGSSV